MKKVTIELEIPAKYRWVCQDGDGTWCAFIRKPSLDEGGKWGRWAANDEIPLELALGGCPNPNCRNTLRQI